MQSWLHDHLVRHDRCIILSLATDNGWEMTEIKAFLWTMVLLDRFYLNACSVINTSSINVLKIDFRRKTWIPYAYSYVPRILHKFFLSILESLWAVFFVDFFWCSNTLDDVPTWKMIVFDQHKIPRQIYRQSPILCLETSSCGRLYYDDFCFFLFGSSTLSFHKI